MERYKLYEESLESKVVDIKIRIDKYRREHSYLFEEETERDKADLVLNTEDPHFLLKKENE